MSLTGNNILPKILNYYREPELTLTAKISKQKRYHKRPRINKKWRKRYGFETQIYPNISKSKIGFFNQTRWIVKYRLNMFCYPQTSQNVLRFLKIEQPDFYSTPLTEMGATFYTLTIKLERFGWGYELTEDKAKDIDEFIEAGKQELKRHIYTHYKDQIVSEELELYSDYKAEEFLRY